MACDYIQHAMTLDTLLLSIACFLLRLVIDKRTAKRWVLRLARYARARYAKPKQFEAPSSPPPPPRSVMPVIDTWYIGASRAYVLNAETGKFGFAGMPATLVAHASGQGSASADLTTGSRLVR